MAAGDRKEQCSDLPHLTALPQPLLELIMLAGTSTEDKKALRQTCKLFQKTLDDKLSCIKLKVGTGQGRQTMKMLLKRLQQVRTLKTVALKSEYKATLDSFIGCLSGHITTLRVKGNLAERSPLRQLPQLTSLSVDVVGGSIKGLQRITGLTHLRCDQSLFRNVGSVAHLAPTLKQLDIRDFKHVSDTHKLTNLEALHVWSISAKLSDAWQLPLIHLNIKKPHHCISVIHDPNAWSSAPTTLVRLTLGHPCYLQPGVLPTHITHLQLGAIHGNTLKQAAAALPGVKQLDVWTDPDHMHGDKYFDDLSNFTDLGSIGICAKYWGFNVWGNGLDLDYVDRCYDREEVLSTYPAVAQAVGNGVKLHVIEDEDELHEVFGGPARVKAEWDTNA